MLYYICNQEKITTLNLRSCYDMLKFTLLFGNNKLEFTDIDVALRSALALSENFNVHMIVYHDNKVIRHVMIKEE